MSDVEIQRLRREAATGEHAPLVALVRAMQRARLFETWTLVAVEGIRNHRDRTVVAFDVVNEFWHRRPRRFLDPMSFAREVVPAALATDLETNDLVGLEAGHLIGLKVRATGAVRGESLEAKHLWLDWRFAAEDGKRYALRQSEIVVGD